MKKMVFGGIAILVALSVAAPSAQALSLRGIAQESRGQGRNIENVERNLDRTGEKLERKNERKDENLEKQIGRAHV